MTVSNVLQKDQTRKKWSIQYFTAVWCAPCKQMSPAMDVVSKRHLDDIEIVKVNIDDNPEIAQGLGVRGVPTLVLSNNLGETSRLVGAHSINEIDHWITSKIE